MRILGGVGGACLSWGNNGAACIVEFFSIGDGVKCESSCGDGGVREVRG